MRISNIEVTHHRLKPDVPFHPTWDSRPRPDFIVALVRVETDEGLTGYGSGDAMPGFAGHEGLFVGKDPLDLERHFRVVDNLSFHFGKHWPLDLAFWDLAGKIRKEPVWRMLGGKGEPIPAYASFGERRGAAATAEAAQRIAERGLKALKLRFFREDWREEIAIVEAVRKAVGNQLTLMVDCNQAWRMPWDTAPPRGFEEALQIVRALEPYDIYWVEEPLHRGDYNGLKRLRDATEIRIAGGELTREVHEASFMIEYGCYDVLQTDVALAGGISGLRSIAHRCAEKGLIFTPHTWGDGIMLAAACQLIAGTVGAPFIEYPCDPPTWTVETRDFLLSRPILTDSEGRIHLSEAPGLGFELDEGVLAATRIG
jgi:L-alanine-DL-glutamate epimerase-like enolase superfamily enzyme